MKNKVAQMGVFLALALILSYVESLIPFYLGIPGVKLGLTNLIIVMMLYLTGTKETVTVSVLRIVLAGAMFGNVFSILYSMAGGLLSLLVMYLVKKTGRFQMMTVSVCGGISHNIGQIVVAALVVENIYVMYYIPVLLIAGILTGLVIGLLATELTRRLSSMFPN